VRGGAWTLGRAIEPGWVNSEVEIVAASAMRRTVEGRGKILTSRRLAHFAGFRSRSKRTSGR
jgi:hypothetical protein